VNDKEKFWIVMYINGVADVLKDANDNILRFSTAKDADFAAEAKAKELGKGYQCAVMESMSYRHGYMTTEKIFYTTSSVAMASSVPEQEPNPKQEKVSV